MLFTFSLRNDYATLIRCNALLYERTIFFYIFSIISSYCQGYLFPNTNLRISLKNTQRFKEEKYKTQTFIFIIKLQQSLKFQFVFHYFEVFRSFNPCWKLKLYCTLINFALSSAMQLFLNDNVSK